MHEMRHASIHFTAEVATAADRRVRRHTAQNDYAQLHRSDNGVAINMMETSKFVQTTVHA